MIECSNDNIWYKKRRHGNLKRLSTFFILFVMVFGFIFYYKGVVVKQIYRICEDYAYSYSTEAVNQAVMESLSVSAKYSDLVIVEKNNNGEIAMISMNSYKMNIINREVAISTKSKLSEKLQNGIPMPLLSFSGIEILSGYGPIINYKPINVVSVVCDFKSNFESVGINQTLHSVYIVVLSNVEIESLFNKKTKECRTSVLVSEAVLVGKVPEIYFNGKTFA